MHPAVDLELQEQAVAARRWGTSPSNAQAVLVGVDVEEGEVALAQRDEVAPGAEVRLDGDGRAVAGDGEAQLGLGAGLAGRSASVTRMPSTSARCAGRGSGRERTAPSTAGRRRACARLPSTEKSANTR